MNNNPRSVLEAWQYHPKASRILRGLMAVGLLAAVLLPKEWEAARMVPYTIGIFCAGLLAARVAAIWQRTS